MKILKPATKLAAICIGMIALAAIICFLLSQYLRVDKPVPYEVRGAYPIYNEDEYGSLNDSMFRIPYLACRAGENSRIAAIHFQELPQLIASHESDYTGDDSGIYTQKGLSVSLDTGEGFEGLESPAVLTSATVTYNSGETETIDLGEIVIYPKTLEGEGALETDGELLEKEGSRSLTVKINQNLKLKSAICIPDYSGRVLTVNGAAFDSIKDQELKKGQKLRFAVNVTEAPCVIDEPAVEVVYETEGGKEHTQILGSFTKDEYTKPGFLQTINYMREGGRLK